MSKLAIYGVIAVAIVIFIGGYIAKVKSDAMQAGIDKQVAADIAKANQNIAERRETDAQFNKMDAAAVCREYGLEWVFTNGKSECH